MYPVSFEYLKPNNLKEALALLSQHGEDAKLLAGGQSLVPMMKLRIARPKYLIDIHRLGDLSYILEEAGMLRIGAMTRHSEIEESPLIREKLPMLSVAASEIGDVQVRNRGTIGGNLAEADPSGDYGPVALACNGRFRCVGPRGERLIPAAEFFTFAYTTVLEADEILTAVELPLPENNAAGVYVKLERVAGDFAIVGAAVQIALDKSGVCSRIGVGVTGGNTTPTKGITVEALLQGKKITPELIEQAGQLIQEGIEPVEDMRGSAAYKRKALSAILRRAVRAALASAEARKLG
jgi:aerobic carbon-monoxide dehydrogenase medium subunit